MSDDIGLSNLSQNAIEELLLEFPTDTKELDLSRTSIEKVPSSIGNLFNLTESRLRNRRPFKQLTVPCLDSLSKIRLSDCKWLVSLPTSICKLKSLERLDLGGCSMFEFFPEIQEPMEQLKFLSLEGAAVKELPSSIDRLSGLSEVRLRNCKRLVSLPSDICKLKSLKVLDLDGCSELEYFPETRELMEHLKYPALQNTTVESLYLGGCAYLEATLVEWTFLLVALCLEMFSIACDQASSPRKPQYALVGMLLAIAALLTCIAELIYKGKKERVERRRWWFYYPRPSPRPFGTLPEIYGLIGGIAQCICSTVQYVCFIRHAENPIKVSLWPAIFLICLGAARLNKNRNETRDEHGD